MPTKRTALNRQRTPIIDAETVRVFLELSKAPKRMRDDPEFRQRDRELHRRLGISGEWMCSVVSVLDAGPMRGIRRGSPQEEDWLRVRAARERLLEAVRLSEPGPATVD
jgi:hypothetical protein